MLTFQQFSEENLEVKIKQVSPNVYTAYHKRKVAGKAITWNGDSHDKFSIFVSETKPEYRRSGVMTQIYQYIEKTTGKELHPASALSDDGFAFWAKYRPSAVKNDLRHFRDRLLDKEAIHPKYGPGIIYSVGSGSVALRTQRDTTFVLMRKDLIANGLIPNE